jgi:LPXTG-motif cell wall-anchored protein
MHLLGMDTSQADNGTKWLKSDVTLTRGKIVPGIKKTAQDLHPGLTSNIPWDVTVSNTGTTVLEDYTLSDVIVQPYQFTGEVTYQIKDAKKNELSSKTLFTIEPSDAANRSPADTSVNIRFPDSSWTVQKLKIGSGTQKDSDVTLGEGEVLCATSNMLNGSAIEVRLRRNTAGNEELTIHLKGSGWSLPAGATGVLTVTTKNFSNVYDNISVVNRSYITPNAQSFSNASVSRGSCVSYDVNDGVEIKMPSVESEAQVAVNSGHSTSSIKKVTENSNTSNSTTSVEDKNYILLSSQDSTFRYDLTVTNDGGDTAKAMTKFVLVDNLPELNDHITYYKDYERCSEFQVNFADKEKLNFVVKIGSTPLTESQYTLQFSEGTDWDYKEHANVWDGDSLTTADGWYTLTDLATNGKSLSDMRSLRVVIKDENAANNLMPKDAEITVSFNAVIDGDTPSYSKTAWNSFGYLYNVNGVDASLRAAPLKVGVRTPGAPQLTKQLVYEDGSGYLTTTDKTFEFVVYEGNAISVQEGATKKEIAQALKGRKFTKVSRTVKAGSSVSLDKDSALADLKEWTADGNGNMTETTEDWTWSEGVTYHVLELPADGETLTFDSFNETSGNDYSFTYQKTESEEITAYNKKESWEARLFKTNPSGKAYLSGAVFGIYGAASEAGDFTTLQEKAKKLGYTLSGDEQKKTLDGNNEWYLTDISVTDDDGSILWNHLTGNEYRIVELKAPDGYILTDAVQTLKKPDGTDSAEVFVTNKDDYQLPATGGVGTTWFTWGGILLILGSIWLYKSNLYTGKKRR